ncbi:MAG: T9SS C-terminal target domain-containing protein, partial [Ignavibacteriae bacterium]
FQIPDSINFTINRYFFVKFINNKTGWAYHPLSGIHTTSGGDPIWYTGKEQINSSIPNQYKLYQNFPNPFNPTTKIKFDVPTEVKGQKSEVRLVIYDILGKEIAVLVNELSNPGTYEIEWNAANYPSGIYYYKITAGDYSETKKMILIK